MSGLYEQSKVVSYRALGVIMSQIFMIDATYGSHTGVVCTGNEHLIVICKCGFTRITSGVKS